MRFQAASAHEFDNLPMEPFDSGAAGSQSSLLLSRAAISSGLRQRCGQSYGHNSWHHRVISLAFTGPRGTLYNRKCVQANPQWQAFLFAVKRSMGKSTLELQNGNQLRLSTEMWTELWTHFLAPQSFGRDPATTEPLCNQFHSPCTWPIVRPPMGKSTLRLQNGQTLTTIDAPGRLCA